MQHQFKIHDVHEYMDRLSEGMDAKLTFSGWEQRLDLPDSVGSGFILRMMIRPGLEVLVEYLILRENLQLHIEQECQVLGPAYHVSGDRYCEWNGTPVTTSTSPGKTVFFTDRTKVYLETSSASKSCGIKVRLRPEQLGFFFEDEDERKRLEALLHPNKNKVRHCILTPAIETIVNDTLSCKYTGPLKRLFMESKALELMMLFVQEQEARECTGNPSSLPNRNDLEKLNLARQVVLNQFEQPLSIP